MHWVDGTYPAHGKRTKNKSIPFRTLQSTVRRQHTNGCACDRLVEGIVLTNDGKRSVEGACKESATSPKVKVSIGSHKKSRGIRIQFHNQQLSTAACGDCCLRSGRSHWNIKNVFLTFLIDTIALFKRTFGPNNCYPGLLDDGNIPQSC